jgi:transcriptional regulator with XRE-family HTH domain
MDAEKWSKIISRNILDYRQKAGLTQRQLADSVGCSVPAISRLESGTHFPSLGTLLKVAEAVGVDPCRLLELRADREPKKGGKKQ